MTLKNFIPFAGSLILITALVLCWFQFTNASAPSGLPATVSTSTNVTLGSTADTLFASSTCAARIVTTSGSAVMLTFSDAFTPTGTSGHVQAASTTVAYDSGLYGCGKVRGFSFTSQSVTVSESR